MAIAQRGITPRWLPSPHLVRHPPRNHRSASIFKPALLRSIGKAQRKHQYLVVDDDIRALWSTVRWGPFVAVEKKDVDPAVEVRPIHHLLFPRGSSTNDFFDKSSAPVIPYKSVSAIARRIEDVARRYSGMRIMLKKGDVKGAFRHLMANNEHVQWMGTSFPDEQAIVVNLAAPFGWSGPPAYYTVLGRAISWLVGSDSPASVSDSDDNESFFGYEWIDDHVLVEPDTGDRLQYAEATLRLSMLAILVPDAINEDKFFEWLRELQALGLIWNTVDTTVSIPHDKISKGVNRVTSMLTKGFATKPDHQRLLGSLCHLALCLMASKPFYQRINSWATSLSSFGLRRLPAGVKTDLRWFCYILQHGQLQKLPLRFFGALPEPDLHLYMAASDVGLTVLNPSRLEYVQFRFDEEEIKLIREGQVHGGEFLINVREHLCIALALWTWGKGWHIHFSHSVPHIRCWSNNASTVSWSNSLASPSISSQEINRAIRLAEAIFNV